MTSDALIVAIPVSLGAAASFAVANVAQMCAARRPATTRTFDPRLLVRLGTDPLWLAGLGASIVGFGLEAAALAVAPVVLVQPLIVAELLFALPLAAAAGGRHLGRREWADAVLVTLGLVAFVLIVRPTDSATSASWRTWLLIVCVIAGLVALLLHVAQRRDGVKRTSAFAVAAGISLGLLSVLTKLTMRDFGNRGFGAFVTLAPWTVIAVGIFGLLLAQTAFRSGPISISLPLIDVAEPLVAALVAVMAFGERLGSLTVATSTGVALAGAIVVCGVVLLNHSPLVQAAQARITSSPAFERGPSRVGRSHKDGRTSHACSCSPSLRVRDRQPLVPDVCSTTVNT